MFTFFKKKCPVCKMALEEGKKYPEEFGTKFCSENCREEYRKKVVEKQSSPPKGCCS